MLRNTRDMEGCSLGARDGEIGTIEDLYFDDHAWAVRYLVVDTGRWLPGRKVLISPSSVEQVDWDAKKIDVKLTKDQVENSPNIDTHRPISRQHETEFYDYYRYPYYWTGPYLWGPAPYPYGLPGPDFPAATETQTVHNEIRAAEQTKQSEDQHLRSMSQVVNYYVEASDGEIGHVEDFLVDDDNWAIRYIVIDTRNWWPGKKVVVSPQWIERVSWADSKVYVNLSRGSIRQAPEYDRNAPLSRDYESRIYRHYGRSAYWE